MDLEVASQSQEMVERDDVKEKRGEANYLFIVLFYFLGTASFMPQSIYVTANEYWMYKFRDPDISFNQSNANQKTTLQRNFTSYAGFAISTGTVLFLFLTVGYLRKRISNRNRMVGSMIFMIALFVLTLLFVYIDTDSWQTGFFVIALIIGGLLSSCSSVLLVSVYELSTQFPPRCMAAQFAGQAICGILAAATQILTLLVGSSVNTTAALYYAIATAAVAAILFLYLAVSKRSAEYRDNVKDIDEKLDEVARNRPKITLSALGTVLGQMKWVVLAIVLCLGCTTVLHPGFTALIDSSGKGTSVWSDTYFLPVCVFFLFNTMDFVARELSNYIKVVKNIYIIVGTSVLRLVLMPLIIFCNIQSKDNTNTHIIFHDDAYFIVFMILLALSNGYLVNVVLLVYSNYCEPHQIGIGRLVILILMIACIPIFSLIGSVLVNLI